MLQCRDIDALMMDWLYGELDPQNAQSFSTHVEDCARCHSELAAYERTRELVGGLPSEEPPPALSAQLIREAAARSTSPKAEAAAGGGLFAWLGKLFSPLQHPALAAVASLILVAGVAGTFYLRDGDDQFAEPEATSPEPAEAATAATAERSLPPSPPPAAGGESEAQPATTSLDDTAARSNGQRGVDLLESRPAKDKDARADLLEKKVAQKTKGKKRRAPRPKTRPGGGKLAIGSSADGLVTNAVSGADPAPKSEEAKPAAPEPDFEGADQGASSRRYRAYRDRPDAWVNTQQLRITEAYNRNDCLTAAKIANDILDRSPELYTKRTRNLEAVKRCRVYVQREKSKRAVARKKRSKSSSKAASKAKRAPNPAPADLEQSVK